MNKCFYRFRKLNTHTIDELENNYFYCAETNELNDPMEGFFNIIFKGDKIVWKNFFKHYFLCLFRVCLLYITSYGSDSIDLENEFKLNDFIFGSNKDNFMTIMSKTMPCNDFIKHCQPIIETLSNRQDEIAKNELSFYLLSAHACALSLLKMCNISLDRSKNIYNGIIELKKIVDSKNLSPILFNDFVSIIKNLSQQSTFKTNVSNNERFLLFNFVDVYLSELYKLIYPRNYIISFSETAHNSSMWGNYADGHKGICLIFNSNNNKIQLKQLFFDNYKTFDLEFKKVEYGVKYQKYEFFSNICRYIIPDLVELWYKDDNNMSSIFSMSDRLFNDSKKDEYWDNVTKCVLTKSKDWEYEREFRLIIHSSINDRLDEKKIFYNFDSLNGIIFGINTANTAKVEIINLIQEKCKNIGRNKFQFYQAYYCEKNNKIDYEKLLVKL